MYRRPIMRLLPTIFMLLLLPGPAAAQKGGITVEDYCHLTQSLLELSVLEWGERANLAATHKGDHKKLNGELEEVTRRYRPLREEIYNRYGLSAREDIRYASEHRAEIESYLDEHSEVRDSIESLKKRINALIEQFESATSKPSEGAHR